MKSEKAKEILRKSLAEYNGKYVSLQAAADAADVAETEARAMYEAEIATLRTALDEANKRCEIAQKVIEQKNREPRTASGGEGMSLNDYQIRAMETCLPESCNPMYMLFGLSEEVGELCGKFAKAIRKGEIVIADNGIEYTDKCDREAFIEAIQKEGGDCFWMLFGFCSVMGWTAESIAKGNLDKLAARKQSNTIVSHTDH